MLNEHEKVYKEENRNLSRFDMQNILTPLRKYEEYQWINEVSRKSLEIICEDLSKAYDRFFKKMSNYLKY